MGQAKRRGTFEQRKAQAIEQKHIKVSVDGTEVVLPQGSTVGDATDRAKKASTRMDSRIGLIAALALALNGR